MPWKKGIGPRKNCDRKKTSEKGMQGARTLLACENVCRGRRACTPLGYENCGGAPRSKKRALKKGRVLSSGRRSGQIQLRLRTQMRHELLLELGHLLYQLTRTPRQRCLRQVVRDAHARGRGEGSGRRLGLRLLLPQLSERHAGLYRVRVARAVELVVEDGAAADAVVQVRRVRLPGARRAVPRRATLLREVYG